MYWKLIFLTSIFSKTCIKSLPNPTKNTYWAHWIPYEAISLKRCHRISCHYAPINPNKILQHRKTADTVLSLIPATFLVKHVKLNIRRPRRHRRIQVGRLLASDVPKETSPQSCSRWNCGSKVPPSSDIRVGPPEISTQNLCLNKLSNCSSTCTQDLLPGAHGGIEPRMTTLKNHPLLPGLPAVAKALRKFQLELVNY